MRVAAGTGVAVAATTLAAGWIAYKVPTDLRLQLQLQFLKFSL